MGFKFVLLQRIEHASLDWIKITSIPLAKKMQLDLINDAGGRCSVLIFLNDSC